MACLPHLQHIGSHSSCISWSSERVFFPSISICHTDLSQLRKRESSMHCQALNTVWIAPVSQEPAFHVSDFSQGALMLIHFILLTHLFFFRLSYLFWTFKYIYAEKETWAVIVHFLKGDFSNETAASPHWFSVLITGDSGNDPRSFNI